MTLPQKFLEQMKELLPDAYEGFLASYDSERHYGLRFNALKGGMKNESLLPIQTSPVAWCSAGRYYNEEDRPAKMPLYSAGAYYIQEPSAMTSAEALAPRPEECIIDMCAAPGGKTTQIASAMAGKGILVANDISPSRAKHLNKNVQISGIRNALVISDDPVRLSEKWPEVFDRVLVDAPCSGEGMFRKDAKLVASWLEKGPDTFIAVQREILAAADRLLKPGGVLVYSTCTYNKEENEGNIHWFLEEYPSYSLSPIAKKLHLEKGLTYNMDSRTENCARVWPHIHKGEGHFIACLLKGTSQSVNHPVHSLKGKIDRKYYDLVMAFADEAAIDRKLLPLDRLNQVKDTIYRLPDRTLETNGIRTFANGWLLGTVKKGRFEPSQAFASGLMAGDIGRVLDFQNDAEEIRRYLKGETIPVDADNGWHLVTVEGLGLGWGKVVNNRLKNKLEPSWRWQ